VPFGLHRFKRVEKRDLRKAHNSLHRLFLFSFRFSQIGFVLGGLLGRHTGKEMFILLPLCLFGLYPYFFILFPALQHNGSEVFFSGWYY